MVTSNGTHVLDAGRTPVFRQSHPDRRCADETARESGVLIIGAGRLALEPEGSVAERPNALALKASVGETTGGSNPSASAAGQGLFR